MKTNNHIFCPVILLFAVLLVPACQLEDHYVDGLENTVGEKLTVMASWENVSQTRTAIQDDGVTVLWTPGERINLFRGVSASGCFVSTNPEPSRRIELEGCLSGPSEPSGPYWAIYPYNEANTCDGASVTLTVPSVQTASEGTFADKFFPAVAKSDDLQLTFYNVCGGTVFTVANEGITSVEFQSIGGESLVGSVTVTMDESGLPLITGVNGGSPIVTVSLPGGAPFEVGKRYYAVFLPGTLSQGLSVKYRKASLNAVFLANAGIAVNRSRFGKLYGLDKDLTFVGYAVPEAVDLGLSVKWASFNLGATSPGEFGEYFAWGETEPYYSSRDPLVWKPGKEDGYSFSSYKWCTSSSLFRSFTKYCYEPIYGYNSETDGKTVLDPEDDAAQANLGGQWRTPTDAEFGELVNACSWENTSMDGARGWKVTGPNGSWIFLPYAGLWNRLNLLGVGSSADYWSSSLSTIGVQKWTANALALIFIRDLELQNSNRCDGMSVRPVYGDALISVTSVESITLSETEIELRVGESFTLSATVLPTNATYKKLYWSSSDDSVVKLPSWGEGTFFAVGEGTAYITATSAEENVQASCKVTVKP